MLQLPYLARIRPAAGRIARTGRPGKCETSDYLNQIAAVADIRVRLSCLDPGTCLLGHSSSLEPTTEFRQVRQDGVVRVPSLELGIGTAASADLAVEAPDLC